MSDKVAQPFDALNGTYACIGSAQNRTWSKDMSGAIDHAAGLIGNSTTNELLIIKVIGRVRRRVPVDFIPVSYPHPIDISSDE